MARPAARGTIGGRHDNAVSPAAACCSSCHGRRATLGLFVVGLVSAHPRALKPVLLPDAVTTTPTRSHNRVDCIDTVWQGAGRGLGAYSGCSLYLLTSDQLHTLSGAAFACSDNANVLGQPCDTVLWPALLTNGAPIAGPGVNRRLLGTVTRTDLPGISSAQQVTYAGQPLYRFFLDEVPGETEGANLDDPVTSPAGIWYLVDPRRGNPAPGQAQLRLETAPVGGTGPEETVLAATMNDDFGVLPERDLPGLHLEPRPPPRGGRRGEPQRGHPGICEGSVPSPGPPVLTSRWPSRARCEPARARGRGAARRQLSGDLPRPASVSVGQGRLYRGHHRDSEHQRGGCAHPIPVCSTRSRHCPELPTCPNRREAPADRAIGRGFSLRATSTHQQSGGRMPCSSLLMRGLGHARWFSVRCTPTCSGSCAARSVVHDPAPHLPRLRHAAP